MRRRPRSPWPRLAWAGLASCLLAVPASAQTAGPGADDAGSLPAELRAALADFEAELAAEVDSAALGGLTAAVMVGGSMVWERGLGTADRETGRPMAADAVQRAGSITKTVTAAAMMALVDAGRLGLDEAVEAHLPEIRGVSGYDATAPITFRQLASHTSGLDREPEMEGADAGPLADWEAKVLAAIPATRVVARPGSAYAYSNVGYGILGLAVSRAAGRPYMDLVRDLVLEPLGMTASGFLPSPAVPTGYGNWDPEAEVNTELPAREHEGRGYKVPNGGLYTTAADLLRFARELTEHGSGAVLSAEARRTMLTVHSPLRIGENYGLGLILTPGRVGDPTHMLAWHDGAVAGYSAMVMVHPESGTGIAWLRNYNRGPSNMDGITNRLLARLVGAR